MEDLTKEQILQKQDLLIESVDVPEWGGRIYVRSLSGTEREEYEKICSDRSRSKNFDMRGLRVKLIVLSVCDKDGKRIFGESDEAKLNKKSAAVIEKVFNAAKKASGLSDQDVKDLTENLE